MSPATYLDLHRNAPVAMLEREITDRRAWTRDSVTAADWTVPLPEPAVTEVLALADVLARQPLPVLLHLISAEQLRAKRQFLPRNLHYRDFVSLPERKIGGARCNAIRHARV